MPFGPNGLDIQWRYDGYRSALIDAGDDPIDTGLLTWTQYLVA